VRHGGDRWSEVPFIALSSYASPRDLERGRQAGFTDYVAKFNREALLVTLQQTLSGAGVPESAPPPSADKFKETHP